MLNVNCPEEDHKGQNVRKFHMKNTSSEKSVLCIYMYIYIYIEREREREDNKMR